MRVSFQKQLIGPVTPAILMCALFFVILALWIVDYAKPSSLRNSLFVDQLVYIVVNVLTILAMSVGAVCYRLHSRKVALWNAHWLNYRKTGVEQAQSNRK